MATQPLSSAVKLPRLGTIKIGEPMGVSEPSGATKTGSETYADGTVRDQYRFDGLFGPSSDRFSRSEHPDGSVNVQLTFRASGAGLFNELGRVMGWPNALANIAVKPDGRVSTISLEVPDPKHAGVSHGVEIFDHNSDGAPDEVIQTRTTAGLPFAPPKEVLSRSLVDTNFDGLPDTVKGPRIEKSPFESGDWLVP